jgi:DNA-binding CsgD family transcriptional regulator
MDLRERINRKIAEIAAVADALPGVIIIHNVQEDVVEYMSARGLEQLKVTNEELRALGRNYHARFFNPEDAKDYVPKLFSLIERNEDDEIFTFFQQVRPDESHDWSWHFSSVKVLLRDSEGKALLCITMAYPIDPLHHITSKVSRLLDENNFLRRNHTTYSLLSHREREVLRLMALGKSAQEIAGELFISVMTAETHRRNIRQKLQISTSYEVAQYARAFDLI